MVHTLQDGRAARPRDTSLSRTEVRKEAQRRKGTCPRSHSENLDLPFLALDFFCKSIQKLLQEEVRVIKVDF